jgi:hypothetical protein
VVVVRSEGGSLSWRRQWWTAASGLARGRRVTFIGQCECAGCSAFCCEASKGKRRDPVAVGSRTPTGGQRGRGPTRGERTSPKASGSGSVRQGETWGLGMCRLVWGPEHLGGLSATRQRTWERPTRLTGTTSPNSSHLTVFD